MKSLLKDCLRGLGFELTKWSTSPIYKRIRLIESSRIDTVLDIGANQGQYGQELRRLGYRGFIHSFEPVRVSYLALERTSSGDSLWKPHPWGMGERDESVEINIAGNSVSSSVLSMLPEHEKYAPESHYVAKETIQIKSLDSLMKTLQPLGKNLYLKIDTQGFEEKVLNGAKESLSKFAIVQLEMSLTPLYQGEALFPQLLQRLTDAGFSLASIEPGFFDPEKGRLLQVDGIFLNNRLTKNQTPAFPSR